MSHYLEFFARGDSSTANNSSINSENTNSVPVTELRFEAAAGGDVDLDYNGGDSDPDTIMYVNGVPTTFTVEFTGTLPNTNKFANVNGEDLRGETVIVVTDDTTGTRYYFFPERDVSAETMAAMPNGAISIGNLDTAPPPVIICFCAGTLIDTAAGPRPVETLRPGDRVLTADDGPQPILWHGRRRLFAGHREAPVIFAPGSLGNTRPLQVSPQHRMVVRDATADLCFGEPELLVPATGLVGRPGIARARPGTVAYHHLLLDRHQILFAEGAASESYHPGAYSLGGLSAPDRAALLGLFPDLGRDPAGYGPAARPAIRPADAAVLAA